MVVVDNLVNASSVSLDRVVEITGLTEEERKERLIFHHVDICDKEALRKVFETSPQFQACIHFAGLKVGTSTAPAQEFRIVRAVYCTNTIPVPSNKSLHLTFI